MYVLLISEANKQPRFNRNSGKRIVVAVSSQDGTVHVFQHTNDAKESESILRDSSLAEISVPGNGDCLVALQPEHEAN